MQFSGGTKLPGVVLIKNINELPTLPKMQEMEGQYGQNLDKIY